MQTNHIRFRLDPGSREMRPETCCECEQRPGCLSTHVKSQAYHEVCLLRQTLKFRTLPKADIYSGCRPPHGSGILTTNHQSFQTDMQDTTTMPRRAISEQPRNRHNSLEGFSSGANPFNNSSILRRIPEPDEIVGSTERDFMEDFKKNVPRAKGTGHHGYVHESFVV